MDAYTGFAEVYDTFMDNVPYEAWCDQICEQLKEYGITDGLILDLGCGTGTMTRMLRDRGYDMIGVDLSGEMLEKAREQDCEGILYLQQDMREFELYGTVRAIICICDSMNYLLEPEEIQKVCELANNYLDPEGIFLFDMNSVYKYRELLADSTICETREQECFIWENYFDEESGINEYAINLFVEQENGLYARMEEFHYQRAYEVEEVEALVKASGLKLLQVYGENSHSYPEEDCERIYFLCQEQGKSKE